MAKTSIVILTFNKLDYTKECIESIRKYTKPGSYELIVVDNASTDDTVKWLEEQKDIIAILNKENLGFPKGCNQGMEISKGENILLLNNDTVVTENWLENLLKCLYSSEEIGAVGPVTNYCSYYQQIPVDYQSIEEMHRFASKYNVHDPEKWEYRLKLIGFCLLIKKEVMEKIGGLDERFTPGNYEDDDYSFRILQKGYKLVLCRDTFIHHHGSISFKENFSSFINLSIVNETKFVDKWGFDPLSTVIHYEMIPLINSPRKDQIRILHVGCACGGTLLQLKNEYKLAELYGIEPNESAATIAATFAQVVSADIEGEWNYPLQFFDYILLPDVLGMMQNPWDFVRRVKPFLKKSGKLLVSIPNMMYFKRIQNLLQGNWTYTSDSLIPDPKPLRFFTFRDLIKMFKVAGYSDLQFNVIKDEKTPEDNIWLEHLLDITSVEPIQLEVNKFLIRVNAT